MATQPRLYTAVLDAHLREHRQMAFVSGPRQVGKTTICKELATTYFDWDNTDDRKILIAGPQAVAERIKSLGVEARPRVSDRGERRARSALTRAKS